MARKATKKPAGATRKAAPAKKRQARSPAATKSRSDGAKRSRSKSARPEEQFNASEALVGLLESPLVADILAAGAAAALATFTHHSLSRRGKGGTRQALKDAAGAAATAMAARLSDELEEILDSAKGGPKRGRA